MELIAGSQGYLIGLTSGGIFCPKLWNFLEMIILHDISFPK